MQFNPDSWPSHRRGEATRQSILSLLSTPRTREELAELCGKSRKQVDRHLSRLSSESKILINQSGLITLRLSAGLLTMFLWTFDSLTQQ
jgi:DNA-binding transcriptional ArsR family regulator